MLLTGLLIMIGQTDRQVLQYLVESLIQRGSVKHVPYRIHRLGIADRQADRQTDAVNGAVN
jgi:hypothetical protein